MDDVFITLLTQQYRNEIEVEIPGDTHLNIMRARSNSSLLIRSGLRFKNSLIKLLEDERPKILNDHGIWLPTNHFASVLSKKMNLIRVVHPRGMIQPWARSYKGNKRL